MLQTACKLYVYKGILKNIHSKSGRKEFKQPCYHPSPWFKVRIEGVFRFESNQKV